MCLSPAMRKTSSQKSMWTSANLLSEPFRRCTWCTLLAATASASTPWRRLLTTVKSPSLLTPRGFPPMTSSPDNVLPWRRDTIFCLLKTSSKPSCYSCLVEQLGLAWLPRSIICTIVTGINGILNGFPVLRVICMTSEFDGHCMSCSKISCFVYWILTSQYVGNLPR